jgi:hypothetical protein
LQVYTAGPAIESDSVPAGSVTQGGAQTVSGGVASEADSAPAGSVIQPILVLGGVASESDSVPAGSTGAIADPYPMRSEYIEGGVAHSIEAARLRGGEGAVVTSVESNLI